MIKQITESQKKFLEDCFSSLVGSSPLAFLELKPRHIPESAGVYLITVLKDKTEFPYYVGRTKNLKQRLYNNHLMGAPSNARLKKHLVAFGECATHDEAKSFIRQNCHVRWVLQEGHRERGAIEGYVTGLLFPKYGIYEEH